MDITAHKGGDVSYHDPFIHTVTTNENRVFTSTDLSAETLVKADCVVLTTNHKDFDLEFIKKYSKLIVDLRNMVEDGNENVYKL